MAESGDGGEPIRPGLPAGDRRHHDGLESTTAFTGIELARVKKVVGGFCEGRTRPEIRDRLRLEYSVVRHDIELFVVWAHWREPDQ